VIFSFAIVALRTKMASGWGGSTKAFHINLNGFGVMIMVMV